MPASVVFSDLHAHPWPDASRPVKWNGKWTNSRLLDTHTTLLWVLTVMDRLGIDSAWHLGDLVHPRGVLLSDTAAVVRDALTKFWDRKKIVHAIPGNHDYDAQCQYHVLHGFDGLIKVYDQPGYMCPSFGVWVGVVPYQPDPKIASDTLTRLSEKASVLLCHMAVNGVPFRSGYIWGHGCDPELIPDRPLTLSGHYHDTSEVRKGFWYVGSLMQQTWGDEGVDKFLWIVDWEKRSWRRIRVPAPQFKTVQAGVGDGDWLGLKGHYVKVLVPDSWPTLKRTEARERAKAFGAAWIKVEPMAPTHDPITQANVAAPKTLRSMVIRYGKTAKASDVRIRVGLRALRRAAQGVGQINA